jgi:glyoxylase-like metal-dependent hydrolase (beta-lactamase superfamily II)
VIVDLDPQPSQERPVPEYSVRTLCYAHVDLPAEFFGGVPIHSGEGTPTAAMHYTLLTERDASGREHHHLVDCGFDEPWIPRFGFYDFEDPETVLGKVGITPSQIETVFVTHMHFDHVNNLHRFPNARVVVQEAELEGWRGVMQLDARFTPLGEQSWILSSFDRGDMTVFERLAADGRLWVVGDGDELAPGIVGHLSPGGHTFGIQWLELRRPDQPPLAIASDTVMWYSNLEEMWPSGYTNGNTYQMLLTYGEILEFTGGDLDRVIPGHDMRVFERFPSARVGSCEVAEVSLASWDRSLLPQAAR